jgi:putative DNA primase/helicase
MGFAKGEMERKEAARHRARGQRKAAADRSRRATSRSEVGGAGVATTQDPDTSSSPTAGVERSPLDVARDWASTGVPVFPVAVGWDATKGATSKRPLTKRGHLEASTDAETIDQWFARPPLRLRDGEVLAVGVVYGRGGLIAFDVDRKGNKDGFSVADQLAIPTHAVVATASGGQHRLVRKRDRHLRVGNVSAWAAEGIDVRGDDGWAVAPGTETPWGSWTSSATPAELVANAPECALELWEYLAPHDGGASNGTRNRQSWEPYDRSKVHELTARTVEVLTEQYGAHTPLVISNGDQPYVQVTRPGKDTGASATVGFIKPGVVKVFSSGWDSVPPGVYDLDQLRDGLTAGANASTGTPLKRYVDRSGVHVPELAADAQGDTIIRRGRDGRLYRYADGVYRPDGEDYLRARCRDLLGGDFKRHYVEEVIGWFRMQLPTIDHAPDSRFINVTNGLVDWRTGVLYPHDPEVLSTAQIAVAWNPTATAPKFQKFLSEVLPDCESLVEELFGYALYGALPFHVAVMCLGRGRNGKSTLLRVLMALVGDENCSSIPLQALGENRFAAANLFGKLANICGDLDARAVKRTDIWKQITGDDIIMAEHKYRDPFQFRSHALQFFSANEPPISSDQSDAWFDRWIILPFGQRFAPDARPPDVKLTAKLTSPDELEGILVLAVEGLRRLVDRGQFDKPEPVLRATAAYRERLDTVRAFINEECVVEPDEYVQRSELYRNYREWTHDSGRYPVSAVTFNDHLRSALGARVGEKQIKQGGRNLGKCWTGIKLDPNRY